VVVYVQHHTPVTLHLGKRPVIHRLVWMGADNLTLTRILWGYIQNIPDWRCKNHKYKNKRVWKLPTSTQQHATWHTDSLYVVVLPSTGALCYHNCCIDGSTSQEYFGYSLVCSEFSTPSHLIYRLCYHSVWYGQKYMKYPGHIFKISFNDHGSIFLYHWCIKPLVSYIMFILTNCIVFFL
jgi:hypothetical protein